MGQQNSPPEAGCALDLSDSPCRFSPRRGLPPPRESHCWSASARPADPGEHLPHRIKVILLLCTFRWVHLTYATSAHAPPSPPASAGDRFTGPFIPWLAYLPTLEVSTLPGGHTRDSRQDQGGAWA